MSSNHIVFDSERRSWTQSVCLAVADVRLGVGAISLWKMLAWQDIRQRYRRSVIDPFWLTISTAIMVFSLAFLYSGLFDQPLKEYLPYVGVGLIVWAMLSTIINESCSVFTSSSAMIKQVRQPFTMYVVRMVFRNLIIFAHNLVIILVILTISAPDDWRAMLTIPLALFLLAINGIWLGLFFGILCARFRDISPMVSSIVQLAFFMSPIMWRADILTDRAWLVDYNPIHHFINIIREPIVGGSVPLGSWFVVGCITVVGLVFGILLLAKCRHRIAYWVS